MRSLVVYYSLTGKTKLVAQAIAEALSATLVEIMETKPRKLGPLIYLVGGFSAMTNRRSKITPLDVDLKQYERIFVGSPIWASRPVPAVNSFVYQTDFEGRSVIPFFSMGGNTAEKALANITAKVARRQGNVAGSLAITSYGVSDDEIISRTKGAIQQYSG
jgi:menaquinone-dependent protoporphyrinogen IX oxidase